MKQKQVIVTLNSSSPDRRKFYKNQIREDTKLIFKKIKNDLSEIPNLKKEKTGTTKSNSTTTTTTTTTSTTTTTMKNSSCFKHSFEKFLPHLRCQQIRGLEFGSLPDNLDYIIGIPTVKRSVDTYLYRTIQSVLAAIDSKKRLLNVLILTDTGENVQKWT